MKEAKRFAVILSGVGTLGAPSIRMLQRLCSSLSEAEPGVEVLEAVCGGIGCPRPVDVLAYEDDDAPGSPARLLQ
ncbi:MAG: hypothetical protein ACLPJH_11190 [Myxococcaceae bacterium]